MASGSFDHLLLIEPSIAKKGNDAEKFLADDDPEYSLVALRGWLEQLLSFLETRHGIPEVPSDGERNGEGENEFRINRLPKYGVDISDSEIEGLHYIRMDSNKAAHSTKHASFFTRANAERALNRAESISDWLYRNYSSTSGFASTILTPADKTNERAAPKYSTVDDAPASKAETAAEPAPSPLKQAAAPPTLSTPDKTTERAAPKYNTVDEAPAYRGGSAAGPAQRTSSNPPKQTNAPAKRSTSIVAWAAGVLGLLIAIQYIFGSSSTNTSTPTSAPQAQDFRKSQQEQERREIEQQRQERTQREEQQRKDDAERRRLEAEQRRIADQRRREAEEQARREQYLDRIRCANFNYRGRVCCPRGQRPSEVYTPRPAGQEQYTIMCVRAQ